MAATSTCPRCRRAEFVRHEIVLSGDRTSIAFYCGHCTYRWEVYGRRRTTKAKRHKRRSTDRN